MAESSKTRSKAFILDVISNALGGIVTAAALAAIAFAWRLASNHHTKVSWDSPPRLDFTIHYTAWLGWFLTCIALGLGWPGSILPRLRYIVANSVLPAALLTLTARYFYVLQSQVPSWWNWDTTVSTLGSHIKQPATFTSLFVGLTIAGFLWSLIAIGLGRHISTAGPRAIDDELLTSGPEPPTERRVFAPPHPTPPLAHPYRVVRTLSVRGARRSMPVGKLTFSVDGQRLAGITDVSRKLKIWRIGSLDSRDLPVRQRGLSDKYDAVTFHPNGRLLAAGGEGHLRIWDLQSGRLLRKTIETVSSLAFHPDGKLLAAATSMNKLDVWDVASGQRAGEYQGQHTSKWTKVAFAPSGDLFAACGESGMRVWNARTGDIDSDPVEDQSVWHLAFGLDVLAAASSSWVGIWNTRDLSSPPVECLDYSAEIGSLDLTPDGRVLLVSTSADTHLYDLELRTAYTIEDGTDIGSSASIRPDGRMVATAHMRGVDLWA